MENVISYAITLGGASLTVIIDFWYISIKVRVNYFVLLEKRFKRATPSSRRFSFFLHVLFLCQSLHQEMTVPVIEGCDVDMTLAVSPDRCAAPPAPP